MAMTAVMIFVMLAMERRCEMSLDHSTRPSCVTRDPAFIVTSGIAARGTPSSLKDLPTTRSVFRTAAEACAGKQMPSTTPAAAIARAIRRLSAAPRLPIYEVVGVATVVSMGALPFSVLRNSGAAKRRQPDTSMPSLR